MTRCPLCNGRRFNGRGRIHDTGQCQQRWYRRKQRKRAPGRPRQDSDLPPELIERIMARRALEQRYERALAQA